MDLTQVKKLFANNKISFLENEPMCRHTTFKIGGNADLFVAPHNIEQLIFVYNTCKQNGIDLTVLGKGSNLLVSDFGIKGVVLSLDLIKNTEIIGEGLIKAEAGATLFSLCGFAAKNGLSGLEFAYGIPGSVGGAVFMNAGAYGGEIKDSIISATVLDKNGNVKTVNKEDMQLSYRNSVFKQSGDIILNAVFKLEKCDTKKIKDAMHIFLERRQTKQPLDYPSAGSTFKRPEGNFAGTLIEAAGLKGVSVGGARVSEKHAGFIINTGNAKCQDVMELIKLVQDKILKENNIKLEPEVIFIGRAEE